MARPLVGFLVRKEVKDHGTKKLVEGPLQPGSSVVIVEDVISTGGSALTAIDRVAELGCKVTCVVGVCDRLMGGAQAFAARGIRFMNRCSRSAIWASRSSERRNSQLQETRHDQIRAKDKDPKNPQHVPKPGAKCDAERVFMVVAVG